MDQFPQGPWSPADHRGSSPNCIDRCRERFSAAQNIACHVNDGRSPGMVPARSVDFAFSFDSLIHVELDVITDYLGQLARVLHQDGVAFIHHSNMGAYSKTPAAIVNRLPQHSQPWRALRGGTASSQPTGVIEQRASRRRWWRRRVTWWA
ncbi:MAG: class I SAM-dependent methyltransferase [Acidimicrobiaceae bacterium]|nr:class I SAM-dependent methyltransferase [Acidimicrobiaceae bacterium]